MSENDSSQTKDNSDSNSNHETFRIVRARHEIYMSSSCFLKRKLILSVYLPKSFSIFIYPLEAYLPELKITYMDANELIPLPYGEIIPIYDLSDKFKEILLKLPYENSTSQIFRDNNESLKNNTKLEKLVRKTLIRLLANQLGVEESNLKEYNNFAIINFPKHENMYTNITLEWTEDIENVREPISKLDKFSYIIPIDLILKFTNITTYLDIKIEEKYEFITKPIVKYQHHNKHLHGKSWNNLADNEYVVLLEGKHRFTIKFPNTLKKSPILIKYTIGIPKMIRVWTYVGFLFATGSFLLSVFTIQYVQDVINSSIQTYTQNFLLPIIAGAIAGILALRVLLFYDLELMRRWQYTYLILVILNGIMLTIEILISFKIITLT